MLAWTKAVSRKARRIIHGSALMLLIVLVFLPGQRAAAGAASPLDWDPVLLDAPRPSPLPIGFDATDQFRRSLVQLSDGGLRLAFLDLFLPSGSEPLFVKRLYRSGLQTEGAFGKGWASNIDMRLALAGGLPRIIESDGRTTGYEANSAGRFIAINGTFPSSELVHSKGRWVRTWENGSREIFDERGRLVQCISGDDSLTLSYNSDASVFPASITDSANHLVRLVYRDGLLVQADYPDHRTIRYDYDGGLLVGATDAIGRRAGMIYDNGKMTRMELPLGAIMEFHYAPDGRVDEVVGPGGLLTAMRWSFDPQSVAIKMTASSGGVDQTVEIKPAAVDVNQWGIAGQAPRLSMQITHFLSDGRSLTAQLLGDKILLDGPQGRSVLDPKAGESTAVDESNGDLDPHEWRLRLTPAMTRDADMAHDGAGRPVAVAIDEGTRESWAWDDADRIVAWTDASGIASHYEYDALNRPIRISTDGAVVASAEYDAQGRLSRTVNSVGDASYHYDDAGRIDRVALKDGPTVDLKRDGAGRPVSIQIGDQVFQYTYDALGNLQEMVDPNGGKTSYRAGRDGKLAGITYPGGLEVTRVSSAGRDRIELKSPDGSKSAITYDDSGRLVEADTPGRPTFLAKYTDDGKLDSASTSDGQTRRFEYDKDGQLIHELANDGSSMSFAYDKDGRLTSYDAEPDKASINYGANGGLSITTDREGLKDRLAFDAEGRLTEHTDSTGASWRFSHTPSGDVKSTSPAGDSLTYKRDGEGRVSEVEYEAQGKSARQRYKYDKRGRVVGAEYEDGTFTQAEYDAVGRIATLRDRNGGRYTYHYSTGGRIGAIEGPLGAERWTYDERNRLIAHEDPTEGPTRFEYSQDGNSIATIDPGGGRSEVTLNDKGQIASIRDAASGVIKREYDENDLPSAFVDPNGEKTTWAYDNNGRAIEWRTPLGKIYRQTYDESGRLLENSSPDGTVKRQYDEHGRLSKIEASDGQSWTWSYDDAGEVAKVEGPLARNSYKRDALGRVTTFSDDSGADVGVTYDAAGRMTQIAAPKGNKIGYKYNDLGQLSVTITQAGRIQYQYDEAGRVTRIDYPNGMRTSYVYLSGLRIDSIATGKGGVLLLEEAYKYDRRGNVIAITRKGKDVKGAEAASVGLFGRSEFAYDPLNRVVSADFADGTREGFAFDPAGNLTQQSLEAKSADGGKSATTESLRYDADQALVQVNDKVRRPDAGGNYCADETGCKGAYDAFGRLRKWADQSYSYDGEGHLRDWRDANGNGGHIVSLERQVVAELGSGERPDRFYVAAPAQPLWASVNIGGEAFYPIRSANGSLLAVTDSKGQIVRLCSYYTFRTGPSWSSTKNAPDCEYAGGRELGPGTWFGARIFSSTGARFLTRDAEGPDKDGNFYAYALGNPLRFVDRQGANATPIYGMTVEQLEQNPAAVRQFLVEEFEKEAVNNADLATRQEAKAIAAVLKADEITGRSTIPLDLGRLESGLANYSGQTGRATLDLKKLTAGALSPQDFTQRLKGAVAHEVGAHGMGFQDIQPWSQGVTRRYSEVHEVSAFVNQRRFDPTLAGMDPLGPYRSDKQAYNWIVNEVTERTETTTNLLTGEDVTVITREAPSAYRPDVIAAQNEARLKAGGMDIVPTERLDNGVKDIEYYQRTIKPTGDPVTGEVFDTPLGKNIDKLKQARLEQAAEAAGRTPLTAAGESAAAEGTVSRALTREAVALEKASVERAAIGKTLRNAFSTLESKAHAALGKGGSAAKKAFAFIANKFAPVGRLAKLLVPGVGQVLAVKDAIDMAIGIGKAAGEAAADLYIKYRKGRDAILNPLDKLIQEIDAQDDKLDPKRKKKKARLSELQASLSPEPAQIGLPAGNANQPGGQSQSNGSASGQPAESHQPEQPLGPTTPLGGKDNQPGPAEKPKPSAPDQAAAEPEPEQPLGPTTPLGGAAAQPPPGAPPKDKKPPTPDGLPPDQAKNPPPGPEPSAPKGELVNPQPNNTGGRKVKDWLALCGGSVAELTRSPLFRTESPEVLNCLCFTMLYEKVPDLPKETPMEMDVPISSAACTALHRKYRTKDIAKVEPQPPPEAKPETVEPQPPPEAKPETVEPQPEKTADAGPSQPEETSTKPAEPAPAEPPLEDGLAPPSLPDFMKPQPPQPEPEAASPPKPTPPMAEPERPSSTEPEKPKLYDKGPKVFASEMTPKQPTTPNSSGASAGGGLAGAYKWAAGWLGYVAGKI